MVDKDDPNVSAVRGIKFISGGFSMERERGHKVGRHCDHRHCSATANGPLIFCEMIEGKPCCDVLHSF